MHSISYATASIVSVTTSPSPACGAATQTISVTVVFSENSAWQAVYGAVVFSADASWTSSDTWAVGGTGCDPCCDGALWGTAGGTVPQTFTWAGNVTIPSGSFTRMLIATHTGTQYNCGSDGSAMTWIVFSPSCSPITSVNKSADKTSMYVGDTVSFCLTTTNTGGSNYTFNMWDTVPAGLTYLDCSDSCTYSGGVVSWTITNLAGSSAVTRCFRATANTP